jgi:hypothetical protein
MTVSPKKIVLASIVVGVAASITAFGAFRYADHAEEQHIPEALSNELAASVTPLIEKEMSLDWLRDAGQPVACAVRPFGTEPVSADTFARVETVYVRALCGTVHAPVRTEGSLSVAVHLTPAVRIEMPSLARYAEEMQSIFPPRLRDEAHSGQHAGDLRPALEARIRALS